MSAVGIDGVRTDEIGDYYKISTKFRDRYQMEQDFVV